MRIFIAYRRSDSRDLAGRIRDFIKRCCPDVHEVFIDNMSTKVSDKWRGAIDTAIDSADLVLILIGPDFVPEGLDGANGQWPDHCELRREISRTLEKGIRLLPIRIDGIELPKKGLLPKDISSIVEFQAYSLGRETFERDMNELARLSFGSVLADHEIKPKIGWLILQGLIGGIIGFAVLICIAIVHDLATGMGLSATVGNAGVWMAMVLFSLTGTVAMLYRTY